MGRDAGGVGRAGESTMVRGCQQDDPSLTMLDMLKSSLLGARGPKLRMWSLASTGLLWSFASNAAESEPQGERGALRPSLALSPELTYGASFDDNRITHATEGETVSILVRGGPARIALGGRAELGLPIFVGSIAIRPTLAFSYADVLPAKRSEGFNGTDYEWSTHTTMIAADTGAELVLAHGAVGLGPAFGFSVVQPHGRGIQPESLEFEDPVRVPFRVRFAVNGYAKLGKFWNVGMGAFSEMTFGYRVAGRLGVRMIAEWGRRNDR